ncbi:hypothetical protein CcCBS67573_g05251 [Chytriomyces confervae]|uniref:Opi1-domain-containing protein n=1 Tax=Chytriomyces confervae TaxID=246404 RepID=A0A507FD23_9FUNG|nr:hypothetical protein CcCBS67573_g05251 [Chytriomyces confervae]
MEGDESYFAFASPRQFRVVNSDREDLVERDAPVERDRERAGGMPIAQLMDSTPTAAPTPSGLNLSGLTASIGHYFSSSVAPAAPVTIPAIHGGEESSTPTIDSKKRERTLDDDSDHVFRRRSILNHNPDEQLVAETLASLPTAVPVQAHSIQAAQELPNSHPQHFIDRLSNIPLVRGGLTTFSSAYEATKNASLVMKYSAETVENGILNISKTLEPALAPLDRFACNQLDKLEHNFPNMINTQHNAPSASHSDVMDDSRSDTSHPTTASNHNREDSIRSVDGDGLSNHQDNSSVYSQNPNYPKTYNQLSSNANNNANLHYEMPQHLPQPGKVAEPTQFSSLYPSFHRQRSSSVSSNVSSVSSSSSVSTVGYESFTSGYTQYGPQEYQQAVSYLSAAPSRGEPAADAMDESQQSSVISPVSATAPAAPGANGSNLSTAPMIARKPRGMWGSVVQGVQSNLGAMVISEDAVRALKWCLKILQEAARNIEVQVDLLRRYLASYLANFNLPAVIGDATPSTTSSSASAASNSNTSTPPISPQDAAANQNAHADAMNNDLNTAISSVTREVVGTLKLVVEMLVKHASSRLPPPARRRVREFILRLPNRWSSLANDLQTAAASAPASSTTSPQNGRVPTTGAAHEASSATSSGTGVNSPLPTEAQRVLTLAAESSAMLKNVMNVFSQTVSGAEAVLGRTVDDDVSLPSMESLRISKEDAVAAAQQQQQQQLRSPVDVVATESGSSMDLDLD